MVTVKRFEDLDSWKLARELCCLMGKMIDNGKFKKNYRLIDQIEGSSGSIMDNIAEGFERGNRAEFITFLGYAKASSGELRSQMFRALDRNYLSREEFDELYKIMVRISIMLQKFIGYLQKTDVKGVRKK